MKDSCLGFILFLCVALLLPKYDALGNDELNFAVETNGTANPKQRLEELRSDLYSLEKIEPFSRFGLYSTAGYLENKIWSSPGEAIRWWSGMRIAIRQNTHRFTREKLFGHLDSMGPLFAEISDKRSDFRSGRISESEFNAHLRRAQAELRSLIDDFNGALSRLTAIRSYFGAMVDSEEHQKDLKESRRLLALALRAQEFLRKNLGDKKNEEARVLARVAAEEVRKATNDVELKKKLFREADQSAEALKGIIAQ